MSSHGTAEVEVASEPHLSASNATACALYVTVGHRTKRVHIFSQFCPGLLAAAPLSVLKVTSRGERGAQRSGVGRRRGCKGHKEQDTGSGER